MTTDNWILSYLSLILICYVFQGETTPQECKQPLGMRSGAISGGQISASSEWDANHAANQGRLFFKAGSGKPGAWSARLNNVNQWLQIDLGDLNTTVTGVASQGRNGHTQWVTKYKLDYSADGVNFNYYKEGGVKEFAANTDQDSVVFHSLINPIIGARYIRFRPTAWHMHISMRVELYSCKECKQPLGMSRGAISDGQISASSEWDANHAAIQGRLFFKAGSGKQGAWSASRNNVNQWLQIDLGDLNTTVTGVASQGRDAFMQWVTKYKLDYSADGVNFNYYKEGGVKEFAANADKDTIVFHSLINPIIGARYIRFRPTAWHMHISMRVELYGCKVQHDPPVAKIMGPSFATSGEGKITLNGSLLFHKEPIKQLNFTWLCRRIYEKFPKPRPIADLPNEQSHSSPPSGCYGYGPGMLSDTTNVLVVDVDKMEEGQTYLFVLIITSGKKVFKDYHRLTVHPETKFLISCGFNCGPTVVSPYEQTIVELNCTGSLCKNITQYEWYLFQSDSAKPSHSWTEVSDLDKRINTARNNPNLVLTGKIAENDYSLELDTFYKINASIIVGGQNRFPSLNELTFQTPSPLSIPKKGCTVMPSEGVALETNFTVDCAGWLNQTANLTYFFGYSTSTGLVILKNAALIHYITTRLPAGQQYKDYNVTIRVVISETQGAKHMDKFTVKVKPFPHKPYVTGQIDGLLKKGDVHEAATLAIASLGSSDNKTKDMILRSLAEVKVTDISEATQLTSIAVMATQNRNSIPLDTLGDTASLLNNTIVFLLENAVHYRDVVQQDMGKMALKGLSNTLQATSYVPGIKAKSVTKRILELVDTLATALLSIKTSGQIQSLYESSVISMVLERQTPSKLEKKTFNGTKDRGGVTFPSSKVLFGSKGKDFTIIDTQIVTFKDNPYAWTNSSKLVKTSVLSLDLKMDGTLLEISNLSEPIRLLIPIKEYKITNSAQDHLFIKPKEDASALQYHKVILKHPWDTAFVDIKPEKDKCFDVFLSAGVKPKPDNYTFRTKIPDYSSCKGDYPVFGLLNCASSPYKFSFSSNVTGNIGDQFIGIRLSAEKSERKKNSRALRSLVHVKDPPTTPTPTQIVPKYNSQTDVNYTMSVEIGSCLYWDKRKQDWTSKGCEVALKEVNGSLYCLCTHLSAFGGSIFVAPNPIDFDTVLARFKNPEPEDIVVLLTVCIIFCMYFIGLVLARRADKNDKNKVVANVFITNTLDVDEDTKKENPEKARVHSPFQLQSIVDSCDKNLYNVSIQTGMWMNCGTTANVALIIHGEKGSSGVISLTDPLARKRLFSRGSVDNFILALPASLGNLTDILIWHDNEGSSPAWFLQEIVVSNQQTEEKWYFFANQWLTFDKRSGSVQLYLKPATEERLSLFKHLCYARISRNLGEGHIWISLFTRPPQSPFTRCQRLSCCLSLLFTAMVTSAMFYQFGHAQTDTFKFGPLVMSWTQIIIGIQSSLIAIPVNVFVVLMFRNIKTSGEFYDPVEESEKSKSLGFLPPFFLYIAWFFCLAIALTGATVTILYSLDWGAVRANQWLTSILVSIVQDVLFNQPIRVLAFAIVLSLLIKKPPEHETGIGPSLFQSPKAQKFKASPAKDNKAQKVVCRKQWDMAQAFKEFASSLAFGVILMFICYGAQDPARYQLTKSTNSILSDFKKVDRKESFWKWVDDVLLPALYNTTWYSGQPFEYKEGFISNRRTFMIGMPRLRQIRIKDSEECQTYVLEIASKEVFPRCRQEYSSDTEDRTPSYGPYWTPFQNYSRYRSLHGIYLKPWTYHHSSQIKTLSHDAVIQRYDGGGYIADLGYNLKTASDVVRALKKFKWIDERTGAIFVEFTLFNPATSLFCNVRNAYEVLLTGQAVTSEDVRSISLYPWANSNFRSFYEACQLLFLFVIVLFIIIEMVKWFRQSRYFHKVWNWVELLLLSISIAAMGVSFFNEKQTSEYVKRIQKNPYETFSSDAITSLLGVETLLLSLAIFIITLKLLRIIRFNSHIGQMYGTLRSSVRAILSFSVLFAIACVAFTQLLYNCFGPYLANFSSYTKCLRFLLSGAIGKSTSNRDMHDTYPAIAYFYVFLFFIAMSVILINIFVAILILPYEDVRKEECGSKIADAELGHLMYNFVLTQIVSIPGRLLFAMKLLQEKIFKTSQSKQYRGNVSYLYGSLQIKENEDDVEELVNNFVVTLASPEFSDIEDSSHEEEVISLEDIKTRLIEISSELKSLNNPT